MLQYVLLLGSIGVLVCLRVFYNFFIIDIEPVWSPECFKRFSMLSGVMYAVSTMCIVGFYLYRDAVKKLSSSRLSVRAWIKLAIEVIQTVYLVVIAVVVLFGDTFGSCGDESDANRRHRLTAHYIFYAGVALYTAAFASMLVYLSMRRSIDGNERVRLYFDNFVKINY